MPGIAPASESDTFATSQRSLPCVQARNPHDMSWNRRWRDNRFVAFEAPTGFGKTGLLLECALAELTSGRCERILYLTSKSTGQLQVVRTLRNMTAPQSGQTLGRNRPRHLAGARQDRTLRESGLPLHPGRAVCIWQRPPRAGRPAGCHGSTCSMTIRAIWNTLRQAGREAQICPYEITRAALAFNDVWVGDYNYVFAPRNPPPLFSINLGSILRGRC
jgi:DNA excision repair protein ERCC-2